MAPSDRAQANPENGSRSSPSGRTLWANVSMRPESMRSRTRSHRLQWWDSRLQGGVVLTGRRGARLARATMMVYPPLAAGTSCRSIDRAGDIKSSDPWAPHNGRHPKSLGATTALGSRLDGMGLFCPGENSHPGDCPGNSGQRWSPKQGQRNFSSWGRRWISRPGLHARRRRCPFMGHSRFRRKESSPPWRKSLPRGRHA
jgi:hypothetical protein